MEMNAQTREFLAKFERTALPTAFAASRQDEARARQSYLQSACVLDQFVLQQLQPLDDSQMRQPAQVQYLLAKDVIRVPGSRPTMHTLKLETRHAALRELKTSDAMIGALARNPDRIVTEAQRQWEDFLTSGVVPNLHTMTYGQLGACRQWATWIGGLLPGTPELSEVDRCWRRQGVTAGLEHLIHDGFVGRRPHLDALAKAATYGGCKDPAVFVEGVGGVGKSTLLGKFLTQLTTTGRKRGLVAYLTFEDRALRIEEPASLMVEVIEQFKSQVDERAAAALQAAEDRISAYYGLLRDVSEISGDRKDKLSSLIRDQSAMWSAVSGYIAEAARRTSDSQFVAIVVLDTWELVSRRASEAMAEFWAMIRGVSESGWLRFVIAGRDSHGLPTRLAKRIRLKSLSVKDANQLLRKWGVPRKAIGRLTKRYGTSPLTLRLVASIASSASGAEQLLSGNALDRRLVQGFLYKRILDRIHEPRVRSLAHPGMVLRRVDADVIQLILAPICLRESISAEEAQRLLSQLMEERGLMGYDRSGRLVFRPELRRSVLALLKDDRPDLVKELHRAAIGHYLGRGIGVEDLSEELYHRLMIGAEEFQAIDLRWHPEVGPSLLADLDDFPRDSVAWLSGRLNLRVDRRAFARIDTAIWEQDVAIKVRQALSRLNTREAFRLLKEREDRTGSSPLFALEVKACLLENQYPAARKAATKGLDRLRDSFEPWRSGELLWLRAQSWVGLMQPQAADEDLATAALRLEHPTTPLAKLHAISQRLGLRREFRAVAWENTYAITQELAAVAAGFRGSSWSRFAAPLARRVHAQLSLEFPLIAEQMSVASSHMPSDPSVSLKALLGENLIGLEVFQDRSAGGSGTDGPGGGGPSGYGPFMERAFNPSSPLVA